MVIPANITVLYFIYLSELRDSEDDGHLKKSVKANKKKCNSKVHLYDKADIMVGNSNP